MNRTMQKVKNNILLSVFTAFCCMSQVRAFVGTERFEDISVQLSSGEVYVASRLQGRLGCTLSRLPLLKKDQTEIVEEALMHKIVTLNHEKDRENPLFNTSILSFTLFDSGRGFFPLMIGKSEPSTLYFMEHYKPCTVEGDVIVEEKKEQLSDNNEEKKEKPAPCEMLSSGVIKDAFGNNASMIVAIEQINATLIAVAVSPQGGTFGSPGSGIALVQLGEEIAQVDETVKKESKDGNLEKVEPKMVRVLKQISVEGLAGKDTVCAYPLDEKASLVTRGSMNTVSCGNHVSLHWDKRLERLFIGLEVKSSHDGQASAVFVARIEHDEEEVVVPQETVKQAENQVGDKSHKKSKNSGDQEKIPEIKVKRILHTRLCIEPVVSQKIVLDTPCDYVVAHNGVRSAMTIQALKTLWTGVQTPYLIVLRRAFDTTDRSSLFAFPLVFGKSFELDKQRKKIVQNANATERITAKEGTFEYKDQVAKNEVRKKALEDEARAVHDKIKELDRTRGTLASVRKGVEEVFSDMHPYALEERRLSSEVQEQDDLFTLESEAACVGGGPLNGYVSDIVVQGDAVHVTIFTDDTTKEVYISRPLLNAAGMIERWTVWRPLATVKNTTSDETRTQRTYFDGQHVPCTVSVEQKDGVVTHKRVKNADMAQEPLHEFATEVNELCKGQILLGAREVPIVSHCGEKETLVCAYSTKQLVISSVDRYQEIKALKFTFPCDIKSIGGIVVSSLQSKILFVGGYNGLYALVDEQGNGLPCDKKIKDLSAEECARCTFVRVGNFDHIRSLVLDGQFLYVLTNKSLERINLSESTFGLNGESVLTTLTTCDALPDHGASDVFFDCVISDKLILLATTRGLWRSGDNLDMSVVGDTFSCSWVRIMVPCQEGPILQLVPVSVTGLPTDCARYGGGELYVLNSYIGYNSTRVTRFHIADCSGKRSVSDATVQLLPDRFMKNEETTFIRLNDYTTSLIVDSGSCLLLHPENNDEQPSCLYKKEFSAEKIHAGATRFARTPVAFELAKEESIVSVALSNTTGKIFVTTTQGLRILD